MKLQHLGILSNDVSSSTILFISLQLIICLDDVSKLVCQIILEGKLAMSELTRSK